MLRSVTNDTTYHCLSSKSKIGKLTMTSYHTYRTDPRIKPVNRSLYVPFNQSQRAHGRFVYDTRGIQSVVLLVSGQGAASVNSQRTVDVSGIVAELLERVLHVHDDLVRQQIAIGVNRSVVIVALIIGIVSPSRIPISRVLIIVPASDQHDNDVVLFPPIVVVPFMPVAAHSLIVTVATVLGCSPMPKVVISCFAIPRVVIRWFPMPRIVSDPFIVPRIVVCCCGLRRLNLWLRKNTRRRRLGFRCLL